jgi:predicted nucleic-acid-binding protein
VIGLDTNVVLRVFGRGNAKQTAAVERLLADAANGETCLLNPIVLAEFAWTLDRTYKRKRTVVADHLERLLQAPEFVVPFHDEALDATRRYRDGSADFADYFLSAINRTLGCRTTLTFDRNAAQDDHFKLIEA